jgi:hypothetical protein
MMQGNHIYTSGATGTNAAVIRGALRAEKPDLLTVVLPQSLSMQPPESQELLADVSLLLVYVLLGCCGLLGWRQCHWVWRAQRLPTSSMAEPACMLLRR